MPTVDDDDDDDDDDDGGGGGGGGGCGRRIEVSLAPWIHE